jgi:hypothetical protein
VCTSARFKGAVTTAACVRALCMLAMCVCACVCITVSFQGAVTTAPMCLRARFQSVLPFMLCQEGAYDAAKPDAREKAQVNNVSWDFRGDWFDADDANSCFENQRVRKSSGRAANAGGFKKRCGLVFSASNKDWFFNLNNPQGACMHPCICVYLCSLASMHACHVQRSGYNRIQGHFASMHDLHVQRSGYNRIQDH